MKVKVKVWDGHGLPVGETLECGRKALKIGFWKWIKLKTSGVVELMSYRNPSWKNSLVFHIVRCKRHGYFIDHVHGYSESVYGMSEGFTCPKCWNNSTKN